MIIIFYLFGAESVIISINDFTHFIAKNILATCSYTLRTITYYRLLLYKLKYTYSYMIS